VAIFLNAMNSSECEGSWSSVRDGDRHRRSARGRMGPVERSRIVITTTVMNPVPGAHDMKDSERHALITTADAHLTRGPNRSPLHPKQKRTRYRRNTTFFHPRTQNGLQ
jgi:hypothetical protein